MLAARHDDDDDFLRVLFFSFLHTIVLNTNHLNRSSRPVDGTLTGISAPV